MARLLAPCLAFALIGCSSGSGGGAGRLASIAVTPTNPSLAAGTSRELRATGLYTDKSTQDLTKQVTWSSSNDAVSTVSNDADSKGFAAGVSSGNATITATLSGISGSTVLAVTDAKLVSIGLTPSQPTIALGTTQQLAATGVFSDDTIQDLTTQVAWSSSAGGVATVANKGIHKGRATGVGVGTATITATLLGVSGKIELAVTSAILNAIEVTPTQPSLAQGLSVPFVATGIFSDATKQDVTAQVTWASSSPAVASVSNAVGSEGVAHALSIGLTSISASLSGVNGATQLIVTQAELVSIEVSPSQALLALGTKQQLLAIGVYSDSSTEDISKQVTWSSSDESVASVSNAAGSEGLVTSVALGAAAVMAELAGKSGSAMVEVSDAALMSIDVAPVNPSISRGTPQQFAALGAYSDGTIQDLTDQVAWSSSDEAVAAVSNAAGSYGFALGIDVGTATISAAQSGVSGSSALTVTAAVLVSIEVAPANAEVGAGAQQAFTAMGTYSDSSTQDVTALVTWSSSDELVALISNASNSHGLATTLSPGTTNIVATLSGTSGGAMLAVTDAVLLSIAVTPDDMTLPVGYSGPFKATGTYSDGSSKDLTTEVVWSTSAAGIAKISNSAGTQGWATSSSSGSATITAALPGVSGSTTLLVSNETLSFITVEPDGETLASGETLQMTATGSFSGGTTLDITTQVNWFSSKKNVATAGNGSSKGLVTAKSLGSATIRAKKGAKSDTAVVTVQ